METNYSQIANRTTRTLFFAQALGSAAFIAIATVTSIAGANLSGTPALAGVPTMVYQLGAAVAAFVWGQAMDRIGRRGGLALGAVLGAVGAGLAVASLVAHSFLLFLLGLILIGVANAAVQLGRFAAAEVTPPLERGRAISNVVLGGTAGAIVGPLLVGPSGQFALRFGLDELAGAFGASLLLLLLAALTLFLELRPEPRDVGREIARLYPDLTKRSGQNRSIAQILREPAAAIAILAMVLGQMAMVMLMVITSLHMKEHQHPLGDISLVISSHTTGMYAFSLFSGRLADTWGRGRVIATGAAALVLACVLAPISSDVLPLSVSLFVLGLGWNFCYVGGSSLLSDQLAPTERARTQGFNDLLVGLASAFGGLLSGFIFAAAGYAAMGAVGVAVALVPLLLTLRWQTRQRQMAPAP